MALNIKDPDTDRLARELASATGESITVATRQALRERLERVRARVVVNESAAILQGIIDRGRAGTHLDDRPEDAILGYDSHGLPT